MPQAQIDVEAKDAIDWWLIYGSETVHLAVVIKNVLAQQLQAMILGGLRTFANALTLQKNILSSLEVDISVCMHDSLRYSTNIDPKSTSTPCPN